MTIVRQGQVSRGPVERDADEEVRPYGSEGPYPPMVQIAPGEPPPEPVRVAEVARTGRSEIREGRVSGADAIDGGEAGPFALRCDTPQLKGGSETRKGPMRDGGDPPVADGSTPSPAVTRGRTPPFEQDSRGFRLDITRHR